MVLHKLETDFTVCKIQNISEVDFKRDFIFLSKTDDEISLVCESDYVPSNAIISEPNWKALKISGILDFGLVGVISKISGLLAAADIPVFIISTFNTDYILLKSINFDNGVQVLADNGYSIK
jgi:hypothetical protein